MRKYLENFMEKIIYLENSFKKNDIRNISKKNTNIFKVYGDALYYFYRFSEELLKNIRLSENLNKHIEKNILYNYVRYTCDFILAQNKESFFREKPNAPVLENNFILDYPIYKEGKNIIKYIKEENTFLLKTSIFKFYFYIFQFFSFIYNPKRKEGVFLLFAYRKEKFKKFLDILDKYLENIYISKDKSMQFRVFSHIAKALILIKNLKYEEVDISDIVINDNYVNDNLSSIYRKLFFKFLENPSIRIEPFSWKISNLIWHLGAILQDFPEKLDNSSKNYEKKEKLVMDIIQILREYIKVLRNIEHLNINEKYSFTIYSGNINFGELVDKEVELYSRIFKALTEGDIEKINLDIKEVVKEETENNVQDTITPKIFKFDVLSIREYFFIDEIEEKFKLHKLIEKYQKKSLYILYLYSLFLKNNLRNFDIEKTRFVGISWTGSVLLHIALKGLNIDNFKVWTFKVFPYIKTHPLHNHNNDGNKKEINILLADESIKTGYTYSLYEHYFSTELEKYFYLNKMKNIVFLDFKNYKKIESINKEKFKALFPVENIENIGFFVKLNKKFIKYLEKNNDVDFSTFLKNLSNFDKLDLAKISIKLKEKKDKYLDFMWLISNSRFLFAVAGKIVRRIKNKITEEIRSKKDKKLNKIIINLYSPSQEGKIINTIVAIILFLKLNEDLNFEIRFGTGKDVNEKDVLNLKYLIDISYVTGITAYMSAVGKVKFYIDKVGDSLIEDKEINSELSNINFTRITLKDILLESN